MDVAADPPPLPVPDAGMEESGGMEESDGVKEQSDDNMTMQQEGGGEGGGGEGDKLNSVEEQSSQQLLDGGQGGEDFQEHDASANPDQDEGGSPNEELSAQQELELPEVIVAIPADDAIRITVEDDGDGQNDKMSSKVTTVSFASEVEILNEDEFAEDLMAAEREDSGAEVDADVPKDPANLGADPADGASGRSKAGVEETESNNIEQVVKVVGEGESGDQGVKASAADSSEAVGDIPSIRGEDPEESKKEDDDDTEKILSDEKSVDEIQTGHEEDSKGNQEVPEISVNVPDLVVQETAQNSNIQSDNEENEGDSKSDGITSSGVEENNKDQTNDDLEKEGTSSTEHKEVTTQESVVVEDEAFEELPMAEMIEVERQSPQLVMMEPLRRMQAAAPNIEVAVLEADSVEIDESNCPELLAELDTQEATKIEELSHEEELPMAEMIEVERQSPQLVMMEPLRRMQAAAPNFEVAVLEADLVEIDDSHHPELLAELDTQEATRVEEVSHEEAAADSEQNKSENIEPIEEHKEAEDVQVVPASLELEPIRMDNCVQSVQPVESLPLEKAEEGQEIDAVLAVQEEIAPALVEESHNNQTEDEVGREEEQRVGESEVPEQRPEEYEDPEQRLEEHGETEQRLEEYGEKEQRREEDQFLAESGAMPIADEGVLCNEDVQENFGEEEVLHDPDQMLPSTADEDNYQRMAQGGLDPLALMDPLPPIDPGQDLGMSGPSPIAIYTQVNPTQNMRLREQMLPDIAQYSRQGHHHHDQHQQQYARSARSKPDSTSRATSISRIQIARLPSPPPHIKAQLLAEEERRVSTRMSGRLPPSVMKMSSVMVSARKKAEKNRQASQYFEERTFQKTIGLDEAINSRPPMPMDLDGPGPWSYTPRNKPLYEDNAPEWSFGSKFPERGGGGRTAYSKSWFNSQNNFTSKTRFERRWPSPNAYSPRKSTIGRRVASKPEYPSFSIGVKTNFTIAKHGSEHEPGPDRYQRQKSDPVIFRRAPAFSMAAKLDRGRLFGAPEITPAPNVYNPHVMCTSRKTTYPAFTISGMRKPKSHALGPHATL